MGVGESNEQREGFNANVGFARFLAYPGSLLTPGDSEPVQVFNTAVLQSRFEYDMQVPAPNVAFEFAFTRDQMETLQRLDQSGRTGVGTDGLGIPMQVLRNDENGITLTTMQDLPNGKKLAAEITFVSDDINERLGFLRNLTEPQMDREPFRQLEQTASPPPSPV